MGSLIDLDAMSSDASLFRRAAISSNDRWSAFFLHFGIFVAISLIIGLPIYILLNVFYPDRFSGIVPAWIAIGTAVSVVIAMASLVSEHKNCFVVIDDEKIEYWTRKGNVRIPIEKVFGAIPEKTFLGKTLTIYFESEESRGFANKKSNFSRYEPVSGPGFYHGLGNESGNDLVRMAIKLHIQERSRSGKSIACLPPYKFKSTISKRQFLIIGDLIITAEFSCDGETLHYEYKGDVYDIPVTAIQNIKVNKTQSQHGTTSWNIDLILYPACGYPKIKIELMRMSRAEEVDKYCRSLPAVFHAS